MAYGTPVAIDRFLAGRIWVFDAGCKIPNEILSMKIGPQIILLISCLLSGQDKENWTVSLPIVERVVSIDTLGRINLEASGRVLISNRKQFIRLAASAGTVLLGGLAWKIQQDADKQYERYLDSGDPRQRQIAWDKTRKLDQTSGWFVVGSQLFIQILIYSYIDEY